MIAASLHGRVNYGGLRDFDRIFAIVKFIFPKLLLIVN